VLRTVTLHLPTNIPPPLHSEIISIEVFQLVRIGIDRQCVYPASISVCQGTRRTRRPVSNPYCFNMRPASKIRHRLATSQKLRSPSAFVILIRLLDRMLLILQMPISVKQS
jgi:hypothetical protein